MSKFDQSGAYQPVNTRHSSEEGSLESNSIEALEIEGENTFAEFRNNKVSLKGDFYGIVCDSKLNALLLFLPLSFISYSAGWSSSVVFTVSLLSLIPFAERLGYLTEQVALYTNSAFGGLLNATFGNATEMIVSISAILKGRPGSSENPAFYRRLIQVSLMGSVLSNLLLVLGSAFLLGGIRHKEQRFKKTATSTQVMMLVMSTMSVVLPAILSDTHALSGVTRPGDQESDDVPVVLYSRYIAICLVLLYFTFLNFQLRSHSHLYEDEEESEQPEISLRSSIIALITVTLVIAALSEFMVSAVEGTANQVGVTGLFLGGIIIPIVGNAAEHGSAIIFAYRNKVDIAINVAIGSASQISCFVVPVSVIIAWVVGCPLDLNFHGFEAWVLFLTVLVVAFVVQQGFATYLHGCVLLVAYATVAGGFWLHR